MKLIDPKQRETWQHPEDEEFSVVIRPVALPTMTQDLFELGKRYLEAGIVEVRNPDPVPKPVEGWTAILPSDIQTVLFVEIQNLSHLTEDERRD